MLEVLDIGLIEMMRTINGVIDQLHPPMRLIFVVVYAPCLIEEMQILPHDEDIEDRRCIGHVMHG